MQTLDWELNVNKLHHEEWYNKRADADVTNQLAELWFAKPEHLSWPCPFPMQIFPYFHNLL